MSTHDSGAREEGDALPGPPEATASAATFVRAMRALRQWSGFTYRQLQGRAQTAGDVLPHSTLAAVLGRGTLPREELLRAFVRACGGSEAVVEQWVAIRKSIAARTEQPPADQPESLPAAEPPASADKPVVAEELSSVAKPGTVVAEERTADAAPTPLVPSAAGEPVPSAEGEPSGELRADVPAEVSTDERPTEPPTDEPTDEPAGEKSGDAGDGWPTAQPASRPLAAATALQERYRWTGVHRRDPAVDVPRPAGLRWLIPPIMYRTGWAARVLSGALVLILLLIGVGGVLRYLRPAPDDGYQPGVEDPYALDDEPGEEEGVDVPVQDGTPDPAPNAPASTVTPTPATATSTRPPVSPTAVRPTTARPGTTAPTTPARGNEPVGAPAPQPKPAATPYLTASVSTECRGGGSWGFSISGTLHNASVGYDPHGGVDHQNGTIYGYPISGDGSTSFSGTVPKYYGLDHELTSPTAGWELEVWVNGDMITGTRISKSGTVSRPSGC
ncbi:hypothetical protein [Micromonospora sp. NBC_01796]|uniref:hypothetical protein n=1 Tax=Micromonospora sp. NBC_01796 TaxID=2975987 RepID=UPI002DDBE7DE|nr:hypothetical protein [Micromonospora sp. NBC_01796]WSA88316.1 hypothetical protein OIE47_12260 [Micromonospora sp. NBC_01796]